MYSWALITGDAAETADARQLRQALGAFPTGVCLVTTTTPDGKREGMTINSFSSVSLDPPLVLFCVDRRSRTWPRIRSAGRFCVNVLAEPQGELCERFGSGRGRRFEGLTWDWSPFGTPALPGVLAWIHADIEHVHDGGDHDIVVGRVVALERGGAGRPMIFFRGRFDMNAESGAPAEGWFDGWV